MNFKRLRIISSVVLIVMIAIVALYFVPLPQKLNYTLTGAQYIVGSDEKVGDIQMELDILHLRYLLKKDTFEGKIILSPYKWEDIGENEYYNNRAIYQITGQEVFYEYVGTDTRMDNGIKSLHNGRYSAAVNGSKFATVFACHDYETILIANDPEGYYFVASAKSEADVLKMVEKLKQFAR